MLIAPSLQSGGTITNVIRFRADKTNRPAHTCSITAGRTSNQTGYFLLDLVTSVTVGLTQSVDSRCVAAGSSCATD